MKRIAIKMLTGDRNKYLVLVFGVAFATLLMAHQSSVFWGVMRRTTSQIRDVHPEGIWVMDPKVPYVDEFKLLPEEDVSRVRGVAGVAWAMPLYKGTARVRASDGSYRQAMLLGLDDATLVGAPRQMVLGQATDLWRPDAVVIDELGYSLLWPGDRLRLGQSLEINDRRAVLVGVCKTSPLFQTLPVIYSGFHQAQTFVPHEAGRVAYVLAQAEPGADPHEVCRRIEAQTGLRSLTGAEFAWSTVGYYFRCTGIPLNFMVVVGIGFVVGIAIAGQTFYLFTLDNLKQFGVLKALGVSNPALVGMILLQTLVVGCIGYCVGLGAATFLIERLTHNVPHLAGFFLPWQVVVGVGVAVLLIMILASLMSIRRVLVLEAAAVFQGNTSPAAGPKVVPRPSERPAAPDLAVCCRGLVKEFGAGETLVLALRGVDLEVALGEMVLLVGPSGCGKTTLISTAAGLLDATGGGLWTLGTDLQGLSRGDRVRFRRQHIGFIFQQHNLLPSLSAAENVAVPLLISGLSRREALARARAWLEQLGIGHRAGALPNQMSGGQQQRVAIARALIHEPRLVICDEPTAALDAQAGRTVMELLRGVAVQPDRGVIVVTHDSRIYGFGDRLVHMEDGRVVERDSVKAYESERVMTV